MHNQKNLINEVLKSEITPATGCTEPSSIGIAVSYAFNAAIENLDDQLKIKSKISPKEILNVLKKVSVTVDRNVFKNTYDIGIPNTNGRRGVITAIALSLFCDPSLGLEIFCDKNFDPQYLSLLNNVEKKIDLRVKDSWTGKSDLYIDAIVETNNGKGRAVIKHTHTNLTLLEANNQVLFKSTNISAKSLSTPKQAYFRKLRFYDLLNFIQDMPNESKDILKNCIKINSAVSDRGLKEEVGLGVGYHLIKYSRENSDLAAYIKARTAAAADVRMWGIPMPIMSVAGSGNQGITATMPIIALSEKKGYNEELCLESVGLSILLTIFTTYHSSYLSALCGCTIKAGIGAAAGLAYYLSDGQPSLASKYCESSIQNYISSTTGMICDGAKWGCSLKLASSADAAYQSALLATKGREVPYSNGILGKSIEESISNVGKIAEAMICIDKVIVNILNTK